MRSKKLIFSKGYESLLIDWLTEWAVVNQNSRKFRQKSELHYVIVNKKNIEGTQRQWKHLHLPVGDGHGHGQRDPQIPLLLKQNWYQLSRTRSCGN